MSEFNDTKSHDFTLPDAPKSQLEFYKDLEYGKNAELYVHHLLTGRKVEVKADKWATSTGNILIEYRCRNKPSGIETTEAELWAFVIGGSMVLLLEATFLRWMVANGIGRRWKGGDVENGKPVSEGLLIQVSQLPAYIANWKGLKDTSQESDKKDIDALPDFL